VSSGSGRGEGRGRLTGLPSTLIRRKSDIFRTRITVGPSACCPLGRCQITQSMSLMQVGQRPSCSRGLHQWGIDWAWDVCRSRKCLPCRPSRNNCQKKTVITMRIGTQVTLSNIHVTRMLFTGGTSIRGGVVDDQSGNYSTPGQYLLSSRPTHLGRVSPTRTRTIDCCERDSPPTNCPDLVSGKARCCWAISHAVNLLPETAQWDGQTA
jgi:hypothetical protein